VSAIALSPGLEECEKPTHSTLSARDASGIRDGGNVLVLAEHDRDASRREVWYVSKSRGHLWRNLRRLEGCRIVEVNV